MIAEIFAATGLLGAGLAVMGWRAAAQAKDRALAELESRRAEVADAVARLTAKEAELRIANLAADSAKVQAQAAARSEAAARLQASAAEARTREAYGILEKAGHEGAAILVRRLMREAGSGGAKVPGANPDPKAGGSGDHD